MATLYKVEMYVVDRHDDVKDITGTVASAVNRTSLLVYKNGARVSEAVKFTWDEYGDMNKTAVTAEEIEAFKQEAEKLNTAIEKTCKRAGNAIKEILKGYGVEANERNMKAYVSQLIKESKE